MTLAYPAGAPSTAGTTLTVDRMLKNPTFLAKRIVTPDTQFLSELLFRPGTTDSGAVIYSEGSIDQIYPSRGDVKQIEPGAAYPMVDVDETADKVALSTKHGAGFYVYDEAKRRNSTDVVAKGNRKVQAALLRQDAARCLAAFDAKVPTVSSLGSWLQPKFWKQDLVRGKNSIVGLRLGFSPDSVIISPNMETELLLLDELQNLLPREDASRNPLYNATLSGLLGLNWIVNPFADDDKAILLQTKVTGVNVVEKPFSVEVVREGTRGRDVVLADKWSVPVIDEPGSALVITGISS
ncbi:major capsid protein [Arthrobacter phage Hirko]|nr:major capsid protein [Arthrobacter phage Hirko]